jgi:hypothetical protein
MFERNMYLKMLELEDDLKITQCMNCGGYDFIKKLEVVDRTDGGVDLYCSYCAPGM